MIVNLSEQNYDGGDYAFIKEGAVRHRVLKRVCSTLTYPISNKDYKMQKPFYDAAVNEVMHKALAVFGIYRTNAGDVRMFQLLTACKEHGIELQEVLCPDEHLRLNNVAKAVDLIVMDYLENGVLYDVAKYVGSVSERARDEAIESIRRFADLAAVKINTIVSENNKCALAIEEQNRSFREDNLRFAVKQLNAFSTVIGELTP